MQDYDACNIESTSVNILVRGLSVSFVNYLSKINIIIFNLLRHLKITK